jgi:8-oxo-dGTP pyrophosphatase MutT (NUDIX family)
MLKRINTGFMDGMYSVPAGKLDEGERIPEAMIREAKEEVGIDLQEDAEWMKNTVILHRFTTKGTVAMDFFIRHTLFSGSPSNCEPEKCEEVIWVPLNAIPKNTIPYVKKGIENSLKGVILDEYAWN